MRKKFSKSKSGMTLIEAVIGAAIVVIVAAILINTMLFSSSITRRSADERNDDRMTEEEIFMGEQAGKTMTASLTVKNKNGETVTGISIPVDVNVYDQISEGTHDLSVFSYSKD